MKLIEFKINVFSFEEETPEDESCIIAFSPYPRGFWCGGTYLDGAIDTGADCVEVTPGMFWFADSQFLVPMTALLVEKSDSASALLEHTEEGKG